MTVITIQSIILTLATATHNEWDHFLNGRPTLYTFLHQRSTTWQINTNALQKYKSRWKNEVHKFTKLVSL